MSPSPRVPFSLLAGASALTLAGLAMASSHSDAPAIKLDPQANLTDVYAFIGTKYDDPNVEVLNVVVNVRPFSEPGDGPHYERFSGDAVYSIHITDPVTGADSMRYDFQFSSPTDGIKNPNTILSYGLGTAAGPIDMVGGDTQNFTQTYDVVRTMGESSMSVVDDAIVAPPNVGSNVTPAYNDQAGWAVTAADTFEDLDTYTKQAITDAATGEVVFAGPRDDSFFADIPGTFDLLNIRILDNDGDLGDGLGQDGDGVDGFKGFNVLIYAIQVPVSALSPAAFDDPFFGPQTGVGVYASVSRPEVTTIEPDGTKSGSDGMVQVNRLANPVFNEALVALGDKDNYNMSSPVDDAQFESYALNSELAFLINFVYGTSFVESGRVDLAAVYIPDVIRVATTTGPVPLAGDEGFHRLGFIGGDTTGGTSSGWPNGRRLGDDVIDIALTAVASGPAYETITVVGDNVVTNELPSPPGMTNGPYLGVFPYAATPNSGTNNVKDGQPGPGVVAGDLDADGDVDSFDLNILLSNFGVQPGG